ncbi:uncharacterized protein LOC133785103 [Humulus lupulus]|uniref:uncharacterized protein LOC133785103 n=1 Tax=Humulus lupulus TaxID=3486 RepID=UPI002B40AC99|nr:uncharacterized protein LOC133785103 [Humulus lupulus]
MSKDQAEQDESVLPGDETMAETNVREKANQPWQTKLKGCKISKFMESHFLNWHYHTSSIIEGRILVMWRRLHVKTIILEESSQAVHCLVKVMGVQQEFGVTFVYGLNSIEGKDRSGGKAVSDSELADSINWLAGAHVEPLRNIGSYFTWSNNQDGAARIYSKIDHALSNEKWLDLFSQSTTIFRWEDHHDFYDLVLKSWRGPIKATGINAIFLKLLRLKHCLKTFNMNGLGDLKANYNKAKDSYQVAKLQAQAHPHDSYYQEAERTAAGNFSVQERLYQNFLIQRSKITWLRQGDLNTSFFHAFLKKRKAENGIVSYMTAEGACLGSPSLATGRVNIKHIELGPKLSVEQQVILLRPFSKKEIREALLSIPVTKSPGPDGYGSGFFKAVWSDIGEEVCMAISDCFESDSFPSKLHETTLSLIPKVDNPSRAVDYRPIACCSTLYKCMAKLLCKRLAVVLPVIVQTNQGAFIQGHTIAHNIMISQDLIKNYGRVSTSS